MFRPPFCPHRSCAEHVDPAPRFYHRHGWYRARCRAHPVPRFRCKSCRRTFSRQTFRMDYRDKRPDLNEKVFERLILSVGLREMAMELPLSYRCTALKVRKIARHLRQLNLNLRRPLRGPVVLQLDELESFETNRSLRPVTVPVLLERTTRYLIWAETETIRPKGKMTKARLRRLAHEEARFGVRKDRSKRAVRRVLARGADMIAPDAAVRLETDEKSTYPGLARRALGDERLTHVTTNSKVARTTWNNLFPVNHEDARMRHKVSRLRRETWLVSKKRRFLEHALQVHMAYRNLVRRRFNYDKASPAQLLDFLPRRLTRWEVLSWAQKWGKRSLHPLSPRGRSVAAFEAGLGASA